MIAIDPVSVMAGETVPPATNETSFFWANAKVEKANNTNSRKRDKFLLMRFSLRIKSQRLDALAV